MSGKLFRKIQNKVPNGVLKKIINFYPPFLGASIKVTYISEDYKEIKVKMPLTIANRNYFGTHYGGSLYSMVDPFLALILTNTLGKSFIVWDKSAEINFLRPGKGTVFANFKISDDELQEITNFLDTNSKMDFTKIIQIKNESDEIVAEVKKTIYLRKK